MPDIRLEEDIPMKKLYLFILMFILLTACMGCTRKAMDNAPLPRYVPYAEIPDDYSLEDAKKDGCVVFENLSLTSGEEHWQNFIAKTQKGEAARIRLVNYYSLEARKEQVTPEHYEEIKDQYPVLYVTDLSYDGRRYSTYSVIEGKEYQETWPYLNHYTGEARPGAAFSRYDCYILVKDKDVTYEALERALLSSHTKDFIAHDRIYINFIKD
jgi:hypothetical protein